MLARGPLVHRLPPTRPGQRHNPCTFGRAKRAAGAPAQSAPPAWAGYAHTRQPAAAQHGANAAAHQSQHHHQQRRRQQQHQQQQEQQQQQHLVSGRHRLTACLLAAVASLQLLLPVLPAEAVLNSPNARIPRTVDAALRRSIPAFNEEVAGMQRELEEVAYLLRIPQRKPWGNMAGNVADALGKLDQKSRELLVGVPSSQLPDAEQLLTTLTAKLKQLELAVRTQQPDFASLRTAESLKLIGDLELLQAPGLTFSIPREYASMPRLVGRAVVRLTIEKSDGALAFVNAKQGGLDKQGVVDITLDGYSAPLSAANFLVNVMDGLYNNKPVSASYTSVITIPNGEQARPPVPLEILPAGEYDPLYRLPLDIQGGELPVLPLSIPGAVSFTHLDSTDSFLSGDAWFIYKFDKQQAGLAGLAFDEGTFGVFGYVTDGYEVVKELQSGDRIVKAEVVSGLDKLQVPQATQGAPQLMADASQR